MAVFKGNTNTDLQSSIFSEPATIKYFIITNKSSTTVTVNLYLSKITYPGSLDISICPMNMQLPQGQSYTDNNGIMILGGEYLKLSVTGGSVDYYFLTNP